MSEQLQGRLTQLSAYLLELSTDISNTYDVATGLTDDPRLYSAFKARLSRLDSIFDKFTVNMGEARAIAESLKNEEAEKGLEILSAEVREKYYDCLTIDVINTTASSAHSEPSGQSTMNNSAQPPFRPRIKVPPIDPPNFNGEISEWIPFKETFTSLFHDNSDLTPIEKFHYLRKSLKGAASQTISAISLHGQNYQQAWDTLCAKYDNKRIQACHYLMKVLNFKASSKFSIESLNNFSENFLANAISFRNLCLDEPEGFILYTLGLRNLDPKTRERFETENNNLEADQLPCFDDFVDFIRRQCQQSQAEALTRQEHSQTPSNFRGNGAKPTRQNVLMSTDTSASLKTRSCQICNKPHRIMYCDKFLQRSPSDRIQLINKFKLCYNCLGSNHSVQKCTTTRKCEHCRGRHHTLLHFPRNNRSTESSELQNSQRSSPSKPSTSKTSESSPEETSKNATVLTSSFQNEISVLLGTACARIKGSDGHLYPIRLLIDSGSQRSFITTALSKKLGLKRIRNVQLLKGFSGSEIQGGNFQTTCVLAPSSGNTPQIQTSAIIINKITNKIPFSTVPNQIKNKFSSLQLADPSFWTPKEIDFLLGADLYPYIFNESQILKEEGYPSAMQTIFGWILMGPYEVPNDKEEVVALHVTSEATLEDLVHRFWELESTPTKQVFHSSEEQKCEEHFKKTHTRDKEGRYVVRLPFVSENIPDLIASKDVAKKRFFNLENRWIKNKKFKGEFSKIINEYLHLDYISQAEAEGKCFLPHHCVIKESAVSTKIRIVFDGSCATGNGSLNSHLLPGPRLQSDIRCILLKFRTFPIAFTADITQMYLRILLHPDDRCYQHFYHRKEKSDPLQEYQLNRVTFGLSSSPFLAIRVLKQLVEDEGAKFPAGAKILMENSYVDDILAGASSEEEAVETQKELVDLLKKGGFELKKWASNSTTLLKLLQECTDKKIELLPADNKVIKVLGLQWDPQRDVLSYKITATDLVLTKRGVLSIIARMYDPLGYLSPVVFQAKLYMQHLWKENLGWDDPLPEKIRNEYKEFFESLPLLSNVELPRCIYRKNEIKSSILIGFSDASTLGYAAVLYLRNELNDGRIDTHLLISKTRLAPLKTLTIPRLELCAALLLVQTIEIVQEFLSPLELNGTYLFTDSTITLEWIRMSPNRMKTFVAHRVTSIIEKFPEKYWHHVISENNAADLPSRGLGVADVIKKEEWWRGPKWLQLEESKWPVSKSRLEPGELPELKSIKETVLLMNRDPVEDVIIDIEKYSKFLKLIRVISYVKRFVENIRLKVKKKPKILGSLTIPELESSTLYLLKKDQKEYFDLTTLKKNPSLVSLAPFSDSAGLIRVGGRLKNSPLEYTAKHPILMSAKSHLTSLIIDYYHTIYLHAGPTLLQFLIAKRYWIVSGRRLIRKRVHSCGTCHKLRTATFSTKMADLPSCRFEQGYAFKNVGVDFAGPFQMKEAHRRKAVVHKAYVCLFVCLSTKALHIEVVSNLTTENFIAALERFISRRGIPTKIMSDNGKNFVGAQKVLKDLYEWFRTESVQNALVNHLSKHEITWEFIPPSAPHFGGIWEAGVKSFKYHFIRVLKNEILTFEELSTLSSKIEAILNSRPLCPLSTDPESLDALTPGHFLIGRPLSTFPERNLLDTTDNRLLRWYLIKKKTQEIWQKWRFEYLNSLQHRKKWQKEAPNLTPGTMVVLKEANLPPLTWAAARIVEVYPGPDGLVRTVKIRTSSGTYIRPITKLAPLFPDP